MGRRINFNTRGHSRPKEIRFPHKRLPHRGTGNYLQNESRLIHSLPYKMGKTLIYIMRLLKSQMISIMNGQTHSKLRLYWILAAPITLSIRPHSPTFENFQYHRLKIFEFKSLELHWIAKNEIYLV